MLQYFSAVFSYGLSLDEQLSRDGGALRGPDHLYADLGRRLEEAKQSALTGQKHPEDVREATFALAAWLDEIVARHPQYWDVAKSLQLTLFDTTNAGDEFFAHLQSLSPQQDEVREIYYTALCLGFRGMYDFEVGDTGQLGKLKELHIRHLPTAPARIAALADERVTAQPYGVTDPPGPRLPNRWPERAAKLGVLVALVTVVGTIVYYATRPPPDPNPDTVWQHLENYACHDFTVLKHESGRLQVGGHVRAASEKEKLARELRGLPGGDRIAVNVDTLSEPFCEVVGLVAEYRQLNATSNAGLKISTRSAGERLTEGQTITLGATLPAYPVCLYVDYFVADGKSVVHLSPSADGTQACGLSGRTIPIGEAKPGKAPWQVSAPFGREMVLAIASPTPLFAALRSGIESPNEYIAALRQALPRTDNVVADYLLVITEQKR